MCGEKKWVNTEQGHLVESSLFESRPIHLFVPRFVLFWDFTQPRVVTPYRRFRTTFQSHFQRTNTPRSPCSSSPAFFLDFLNFEDGAETSVRNYHSTLWNMPEECGSDLLCGGSLKSRILYLTEFRVLLLCYCRHARIILYFNKATTTCRQITYIPSLNTHNTIEAMWSDILTANKIIHKKKGKGRCFCYPEYVTDFDVHSL